MMTCENTPTRTLPRQGAARFSLYSPKQLASLLVLSSGFVLAGATHSVIADEGQLEDAMDSMDLESLLNMEVTSVSKKAFRQSRCNFRYYSG